MPTGINGLIGQLSQSQKFGFVFAKFDDDEESLRDFFFLKILFFVWSGALLRGRRGDLSPHLFEVEGTWYHLSPPLFYTFSNVFKNVIFLLCSLCVNPLKYGWLGKKQKNLILNLKQIYFITKYLTILRTIQKYAKESGIW